MARNKLVSLIDGYSGQSAERRFFSAAYSGSVSAKKQRDGGLSRLFAKGKRVITYTSSKAYGASGLAFGLLTAILSFLRRYSDRAWDDPTLTLIIGIVVAALSLPFLMSDRPLAFVFQDIPVTDYIFYDLLCMKRVPKIEGVRTVNTFAATVIGVMLAALGVVLPVWMIAAAVLCLVVIFLAMSSPEFSFLLSLVLVPYSDTSTAAHWVFIGLVGVTFISMVVKIAYGKRVIFFNQYDLLIAVIVLSIMVSGLFSDGADSLRSAAAMIVLTCGYTVASCLVSNRRIADSALGILVISSVPVSLVSIVTFCRLLAAGEAGSIVGTGLCSTMSDSTACAVFLLVAICSAAALVKQGHGKVARALCACAMLIQLVALVLTGELLAVAALPFGLAVYFVIKTRYFSMAIVPLLLLLPYLFLFLIPESWEEAVYSVIPSLSDTGFLPEVWRDLLPTVTDNPFVGIGAGRNGGAHNLILEIVIEAGVICAVAFALLLIVRLRHLAVYYPYIRSSAVESLCPGMAVTVFTLMFYGAAAYVLASGCAYYLFWVVLGIGGALLRIAARDHDDRVNYYEDNRSSDASDLDVQLFR